MKLTKSSLCLLILTGFGIRILQAQATIPATGINATGSDGSSVSITVGQIFCNTISGSTLTISQGIQQPFEISIVTAIKNRGEIFVECSIFPNPSRGTVKLLVRTKEYEKLRLMLYDLNGKQMQSKTIEKEETEIMMDSLVPSVYYLKVLRGNIEIETFKIIKN